MLWVALDLGRTTHMALDQHRLCDTGERNGAGEEQRAARDEVLGLAHVGDDRLGGLLGARADAGKGQRRAHQLQELTAALRVIPLGRLFRKFPVQILAESRRVGQLSEAAPIQAAT